MLTAIVYYLELPLEPKYPLAGGLSGIVIKNSVSSCLNLQLLVSAIARNWFGKVFQRRGLRTANELSYMD